MPKEDQINYWGLVPDPLRGAQQCLDLSKNPSRLSIPDLSSNIFLIKESGINSRREHFLIADLIGWQIEDGRGKAAKCCERSSETSIGTQMKLEPRQAQHIGKENQQVSLLSSGTNPAVMWPCIVVYMCQDLVNNSEGSQLQNYVCRDFPEAIKPPPPPYPSPQNVCLFEVDILFWFSHKIVDWTPCTFQFCLRNKW